MYGMMHRMAQASQQSQARGETKPMNPAKDVERYKQALEQIANSPFIKGYEAIAIARDALGVKPK